MSISNRRISIVLLSLIVIIIAKAGDPSDLARGRYVPGSQMEQRKVVIDFNPNAVFWVAHLGLDNFSESGYQIMVFQGKAAGPLTYFRKATDDEWLEAPLRLFFDARFWKKEPGAIRPVLVRRVDESGKATLYVEPLP